MGKSAPDTFPFQYSLWKNVKNLLQQYTVPAHFLPIPRPVVFPAVPYWNQNSHHHKTPEKAVQPAPEYEKYNLSPIFSG